MSRSPWRGRGRRWVGLLGAAAIALAACSGGTSVGGRDLTEGLGDAVDLERLGEASEAATPEASASIDDASPEPSTPATPSPSATPSATPTPAPSPSATAAIIISINPDGASEPPFSPRIAEVPAGSLVTWTNRDSVERSVLAQNGSFASPFLAPGESWSLTFTEPGTYDYSDGTRVYVLGTIEVVP